MRLSKRYVNFSQSLTQDFRDIALPLGELFGQTMVTNLTVLKHDGHATVAILCKKRRKATIGPGSAWCSSPTSEQKNQHVIQKFSIAASRIYTNTAGVKEPMRTCPITSSL